MSLLGQSERLYLSSERSHLSPNCLKLLTLGHARTCSDKWGFSAISHISLRRLDLAHPQGRTSDNPRTFLTPRGVDGATLLTSAVTLRMLHTHGVCGGKKKKARFFEIGLIGLIGQTYHVAMMSLWMSVTFDDIR